jgi:diaminopimelate dehydrogenase
MRRTRLAIIGFGRLGRACVRALRDGHDLEFERRGTGAAGDAGSHQSLLLEARFDVAAFAARVMLDAARGLPQFRAGAHVYSLWL